MKVFLLSIILTFFLVQPAFGQASEFGLFIEMGGSESASHLSLMRSVQSMISDLLLNDVEAEMEISPTKRFPFSSQPVYATIKEYHRDLYWSGMGEHGETDFCIRFEVNSRLEEEEEGLAFMRGHVESLFLNISADQELSPWVRFSVVTTVNKVNQLLGVLAKNPASESCWEKLYGSIDEMLNNIPESDW